MFPAAEDMSGFFRLWNVGAGQGVESCVSLADRIFIRLAQVGVGDQLRHIVAVQIGETLDRLHATAMAMHVAKAADIHEDVEAQLVAGREGARQLSWRPRWRVPSSSNSSWRGASRAHTDRESDGRDSGGAVEQGGDDLDLDGFVFAGAVGFDQIDERRGLDGRGLHQVQRRLFNSIRDFWMYSTGAAYFTRVGATATSATATRQRVRQVPDRRRQCHAATLRTRRVAHSSKEMRPLRAVFRPGGGLPHGLRQEAGDLRFQGAALTISPREVFAASGNR